MVVFKSHPGTSARPENEIAPLRPGLQKKLKMHKVLSRLMFYLRNYFRQQ